MCAMMHISLHCITENKAANISRKNFIGTKTLIQYFLEYVYFVFTEKRKRNSYGGDSMLNASKAWMQRT